MNMCAVLGITSDGRLHPAAEQKEFEMMMNTTLDQLRALKLLGMAAGLQDQLTSAGMACMSFEERTACLLYTSPSPRDLSTSRMPSSA